MNLKYTFPNDPATLGFILLEETAEKYFMLYDLTLCISKEAGGAGVNYIIKVVENLEAVLRGEMQEHEFGYDYTIVDFRKEVSVVNYDFFGSEIEIESESLYRLMRDWRDYLIEQFKATGRDV